MTAFNYTTLFGVVDSANDLAPVLVTFQGQFVGDVSSTTIPVTNPTGSAIGDVVVAYIVQGSGTATITVSSGTGWTRIDPNAQQSGSRVVVFWKRLTGTGDSLVLSSTSSSFTFIRSFRIAGATQASGTGTSNGNTALNPPSHASGFTGAKVWLALAHTAASRTFTAGPTGYGGFTNQGNFVFSAWKEDTTNTEDPNSFSGSTNNTNIAWTIAVGNP
jgi:hypothetical protein